MLGCGRGGVKKVAALADYGDAASRNRQQRRVLAHDLGPERRAVQEDHHLRWNGVKHRIAVERFSAAWLF